MIQRVEFNPTGKLSSAKWDEASFVFFSHEETGLGPKLAARFVELAGA